METPVIQKQMDKEFVKPYVKSNKNNANDAQAGFNRKFVGSCIPSETISLLRCCDTCAVEISTGKCCNCQYHDEPSQHRVLMMNTHAFADVIRDSGRTTKKPRAIGRTAVMDTGLPVETQENYLKMAAAYIDEAKIMTGTSTVYETDYLRRKLSLYNDYEVRPFLGGLLLERIFSDSGFDGANQYFDEAYSLGIGAVEVSGTNIDINISDREKLTRLALERDLQVHGEIGSNSVTNNSEILVAEAIAYIDAGADVVIVEGAEMYMNREPNHQFCENLSAAIKLDNLYFELTGPWVAGTCSWEARSLRKFLFDYFGANVNLANVHLEDIIETETYRWNLGE